MAVGLAYESPLVTLWLIIRMKLFEKDWIACERLMKDNVTPVPGSLSTRLPCRPGISPVTPGF